MLLSNGFKVAIRVFSKCFRARGTNPPQMTLARSRWLAAFRCPRAFREYTMSALGGTYIGVNEQVWPRPKALDVGPFWSFLYAIKVFGIAEGIPDWLDLRVQYQEFKEEGYGHLVPFLQVQGDADWYCFNSRGQIVQWQHEEPDNERLVKGDCMALILSEIHALAERAERRKRGEHRRR